MLYPLAKMETTSKGGEPKRNKIKKFSLGVYTED
jgi:hypothetical protein